MQGGSTKEVRISSNNELSQLCNPVQYDTVAFFFWNQPVTVPPPGGGGGGDGHGGGGGGTIFRRKHMWHIVGPFTKSTTEFHGSKLTEPTPIVG